jgi:hypothetical protein
VGGDAPNREEAEASLDSEGSTQHVGTGVFFVGARREIPFDFDNLHVRHEVFGVYCQMSKAIVKYYLFVP